MEQGCSDTASQLSRQSVCVADRQDGQFCVPVRPKLQAVACAFPRNHIPDTGDSRLQLQDGALLLRSKTTRIPFCAQHTIESNSHPCVVTANLRVT